MARSIEQRGHHVTRALIGTSRQCAAYNYTNRLALGKKLEHELVDANGGIEKVRVELATRSCHLNALKTILPLALKTILVTLKGVKFGG